MISRGRRTLVGLSLGYFMVLFDTTALTVALPELGHDLGAGLAELAWVTDAYTLAFAGSLLAAGVASDRLGAPAVFTAGLAAFAALSLACAAAPSCAVLIGTRAMLGLAGALLLPASLALVAGLHADASRRARAIGMWASISALALAAGPLLGGALVAASGWRGVFFVNAPVALAAALLVRGRLPDVPTREARIDVRGQIAVVIAVTALTWAAISGGTGRWTAPDVVAALAVTLIAAGTAVRSERTAAAPVVPAALRRAPLFAGATVGGLVVGGVLAGELFVTTLQLQQQRAFGPVLCGIAFLPLTVPMIVTPPLAGRLVARVGPARPVLAGLGLVAAGAGVLAAVPAAASYVWVAAGLVLLGFGVSLTLPALTSAVVVAAPAGATGAAGGLFSVARQTGAALGVAAAGAALGRALAGASLAHAVLAVAALAAGARWSRASRRAQTAS